MKPIPRKTRPTGTPAPAGKTPTPAAKTPMATAKTPTATAKTPTAAAKTPTATAKAPTATAKTPTAAAKTPTATAKTATASAKTPTATAKAPTATAKAPTATAKMPTATAKAPTATAKAPTATAKTPTVTAKTTTAKTTAGARTAPAGKTLSVQRTAAQRGIAPSRTASANGLRDLFEVGLKDIYYAEKVLAQSLPKMVKNATSPQLVNELNNHLAVTKEQVSRLEQIFKSTGIKAQAVKCDAMDGLLKETDNIMQLAVKGTVRDAGIISSDQKVDHYEIASFGTLHAYAKTLGEHEAANLLSLTLDEAKKVDAALTRLAMTGINSQAWKADAITTIKRK